MTLRVGGFYLPLLLLTDALFAVLWMLMIKKGSWESVAELLEYDCV